MLLSKYNFELSTEEIDRILASVEKNLENWMDARRLSQCIGFMDLTSLNSTDTQSKITKLVEKVNGYRSMFPEYELPASICVYPNFAKTVKENLSAGNVRVTAVGGCFPASQSFTEVKVMECRMAVENGADEVDIVIPLNKFLAGDYEGTSNEIKAIREAVRGARLKVILETGTLQSVESAAEASFLAMEAGADFIKTSTGKLEPAATPTAAIIMCTAIRQFYKSTGRKVGFKPAGGIVTCEEAIAYYAIVESILGKEWLTPELFRIGASRLANNILTKLEDNKISYF